MYEDLPAFGRLHEIPHPPVVLRRNREGRETQAREFGDPRLMLRLVALVDGHHAGDPGLAHDERDLLIQRMHPLLHIHDQQGHGGIPDRRIDLGADPRLDRALSRLAGQEGDPARVNQGEALLLPLHFPHQPVAGHPALVMHDRDAPARDAIEHGRLADIGTPDNHDNPRPDLVL